MAWFDTIGNPLRTYALGQYRSFDPLPTPNDPTQDPSFYLDAEDSAALQNLIMQNTAGIPVVSPPVLAAVQPQTRELPASRSSIPPDSCLIHVLDTRETP